MVPELKFARLEAHIVLRPLLITSLVLAEHLIEQAGFGAETIVVLSASSKVALGLAHRLAGRWPLLGLSSSGNRRWVEGTGLYERVVAYEELTELGRIGPCLVLDLAGNGALTDRLCALPGIVCRQLLRVGATHGVAPQVGPADAMRPDGMFFWSPEHIERRVASWGPAAFETRLAQAIDAFSAAAGRNFERCYADGPQALREHYERLQRGAVPPWQWLLARPGSPP